MPVPPATPRHQLLTSLVEGHQLTTDALERVMARLERIEGFLARIPPSFMPAFNDFVETEDEARLLWGLMHLVRDTGVQPPHFPQDVKDARMSRRLARKYEQAQQVETPLHTGTVET